MARCRTWGPPQPAPARERYSSKKKGGYGYGYGERISDLHIHGIPQILICAVAASVATAVIGYPQRYTNRNEGCFIQTVFPPMFRVLVLLAASVTPGHGHPSYLRQCWAKGATAPSLVPSTASVFCLFFGLFFLWANHTVGGWADTPHWVGGRLPERSRFSFVLAGLPT